MQKTELYLRISKVQTANPYFHKDLEKAKKATKFIGRGSVKSSTHKYMVAAGDLANTGTYTEKDTIFVSAEGARTNRLTPNFEELDLAIAAKAIFVTDNQHNRNRDYNRGEREVATYLLNHRYKDIGNGIWKKE